MRLVWRPAEESFTIAPHLSFYSRDPAVRDHSVKLYSADDSLAEEVARYFRAGLREGETCIGVATAPHRRDIARKLGADAARVTLLDAPEELARFDTGTGLSRAAFDASIGRAVQRAAAGGTAVRAFGEMVTLLCADDRPGDALDLEAYWIDVMTQEPVELLCAYPLRVFERATGGSVLKSVCDLHPHVLPIEGVGRPTERSAARGTAARRAIPRHVLVVDPDPKLAEALARCLNDAGHRVHVASDGASAIAEVVRSRPEIVLLDVALPKIDGYEVARRLRALPALHPCVLVAVTGVAGPEDVARTKRAGFDHHLAKPLDLHRVEALLESGL